MKNYYRLDINEQIALPISMKENDKFMSKKRHLNLNKFSTPTVKNHFNAVKAMGDN